jgi:hypothetical protein
MEVRFIPKSRHLIAVGAPNRSLSEGSPLNLAPDLQHFGNDSRITNSPTHKQANYDLRGNEYFLFSSAKAVQASDLEGKSALLLSLHGLSAARDRLSLTEGVSVLSGNLQLSRFGPESRHRAFPEMDPAPLVSMPSQGEVQLHVHPPPTASRTSS